MESNKIKRGYVREDGYIFWRKSGGQNQFVSPETFEELKAKQRERSSKNLEKYRKSDKKWKLGEINPENGLYFIRNDGAYRPLFGTLEDVEAHRAKKRKWQQDMAKRRKPIEKVFSRGDIDPVLNKIFWKYNYRDGKEIWITKEKFAELKHKRIK